MFTKKTITSILLSVIFITGFSFTSYGKTPVEKMPEFKKYQELILSTSELSNFTKKLYESSWAYKIGENGKPIEKFCIGQEIQSTNANEKVHIKYGVFSNTNEAHKAIMFHINHIAEVMRSNPQFESELIQVPDEAYFELDGTTIIFRIKNTCVLLFCYGSGGKDIKTESEAVIKFANQIIEKIEKIE